MTHTSVPLPEPRPGSEVTFRRYGGLDDIPGMGAANARLRAHVGVIEPIDIEAMRHRYEHLVNCDPLVDCLVAEVGGRIVGYARAEWHDLADGDRIYDTTQLLAPDAWSLGISDGFIGWSEAREREMAVEHPTARRAWLGNSHFRGDDELAAALDRHGYRPVRWDAELRRPDLDAIEDAPLATGYTLRSPSEAELPAVWDMMVEAFREHWGSWEDDDQVIERWAGDPRFRLDLTVVAWRGDEPAACVSNVIDTRADGTRSGLLDSVCTHPGHRRLGLARAAITESLRRLRAEGATSAYLGVDTDNANRAYALYESCGFRVVSGSVALRKPFEAA